ncbi:hypothetical protein BO70DRAFT_398681 [Aspergillus heteromorphus CBS 117.55]|uniref:Uncharacterized protein n=1 Tax=Aspergillus heteromorphus CBS 117.55 TaxID=1448321 RepID=A0A317VJ32_9EURO|nr:uncharacterized protein BO70DRAFT_398681 [Aspergillus heteromorphus CBS 117.55]PWY74353.1 hypothetical protein BO70DRAFT_398681 [Aspergillus heteromorphus CBS 117.55]
MVKEKKAISVVFKQALGLESQFLAPKLYEGVLCVAMPWLTDLHRRASQLKADPDKRSPMMMRLAVMGSFCVGGSALPTGLQDADVPVKGILHVFQLGSCRHDPALLWRTITT